MLVHSEPYMKKNFNVFFSFLDIFQGPSMALLSLLVVVLNANFESSL